MPKLAVAQTRSLKGDVESNIANHIRFINIAIENEAELIVFPELSLTGYEPELANDLAFSESDHRLNELKKLASESGITIIAGAPFTHKNKLYISSLIIHNDLPIEVYTKHHLHTGEERFFIPGNRNPVINLDSALVSNAICADITHPEHAENAAKLDTDIYLASVFITHKGIDPETKMLEEYAKTFNMAVGMSNYTGTTMNTLSAGQSIFINEQGKALMKLPDDGEGLILAEKKDLSWKVESITY